MKKNSNNSRDHHWWPVGLQAHWAVDGDVNSMDISGRVVGKKYYNEKIGRKAHGHSIRLDSEFWSINFERDFQDADNAIPGVVAAASGVFSLKRMLTILWRAFGRRLRRRLELQDFSQVADFDETFRNNLALVCFSLLIRSPANRHRLENSGTQFGMPADENVGKLNLFMQTRALREAHRSGFGANLFPLIIYSHRKEFIFGDGLLDGITGSIQSGSVRGHGLVPLTPHICVFLCTPRAVRSDRNARILLAPDWLTAEINEITQVYSRNSLFFSKQRPKLVDHFSKGEHLAFKHNKTPIVEQLLAVCGD